MAIEGSSAVEMIKAKNFHHLFFVFRVLTVASITVTVGRVVNAPKIHLQFSLDIYKSLQPSSSSTFSSHYAAYPEQRQPLSAFRLYRYVIQPSRNTV